MRVRGRAIINRVVPTVIGRIDLTQIPGEGVMSFPRFLITSIGHIWVQFIPSIFFEVKFNREVFINAV